MCELLNDSMAAYTLSFQNISDGPLRPILTYATLNGTTVDLSIRGGITLTFYSLPVT